MNSQIDNHGQEHLINAFAKKEASLLSMGILVIVVFMLQRGMIEIREWLLLKLMVISHQLFAILLPVWLSLTVSNHLESFSHCRNTVATLEACHFVAAPSSYVCKF